MIETAVVIGTVGVLIVLIIGTARGLTWVAENYPKPYRWLAGTSTVGIFLAIIVDAFIVPFGTWGVSAVLLLAIP